MPALKVEVKHSFGSVTGEAAHDLHLDILFAYCTIISLTRNLRSVVGMVNSIRGEVVKIVLGSGQRAPA